MLPMQRVGETAMSKDIDFNNLTTADLDRILDVPYVLWFCPKGCRGQVEWDKPAMIATCLVCRAKSSDGKETK